MNKNLLTMALVTFTALVMIGCARTADTNINATLTTNRNSIVEPANTAAIEAELIKMEKDWAGSFKTKDATAVRRILADDVMLTYPDGSTGTKNDEIQLTETGAITADSWDTLDTKVTVLDADAAFVTGRSVVKNGKLKDPRSQQTIDITGEYRFVNVYAKRNGNWQIVASQATQVRPQQ